jgi:hypothetical protein
VLNDTKKYPLQWILCHFDRINAVMRLLVVSRNNAKNLNGLIYDNKK